MIIIAFLLDFITSIIIAIYGAITEFSEKTETFILVYMQIGVVLIVLATIYALIKRNKKLRYVIDTKRHLDKNYYKEPPYTYSPVIVTYIENLKIEIEKDIVAEILFLEKKGYVLITKDESGQFLVATKVQNNNDYELLKSQKYILNQMTFTVYLKDLIENIKKDQTKIEELYEEDCYDLGYLIRSKDILKNKKLEKGLIIAFCIPLLFIIVGAIIYFMFQSENLFKIFGYIVIFYMTAAILMLPSLGIGFIFEMIFNRIILFRTPKAKEDYIKWMYFKEYLKEYTLVKNYNLDSAVVLEDYLTYAIALGITKINI